MDNVASSESSIESSLPPSSTPSPTAGGDANGGVASSGARVNGIQMPPLRVPPRQAETSSHVPETSRRRGVGADEPLTARGCPNRYDDESDVSSSIVAADLHNSGELDRIPANPASAHVRDGAQSRAAPRGDERDAIAAVGRRPMAASMSADGAFAGRRASSLLSVASVPPDPRQARDNAAMAANGGAEEDAMGADYLHSSWHQTLLQFPSLLRLYPLAANNEFDNPEEAEQLQLDGEEVKSASGRVGSFQSETQRSGDRSAPQHASRRSCAEPPAMPVSPPRTPLGMNGSVYGTPKSAPSRSCDAVSSARRGHGGTFWPADDLPVAWAELDRAQQQLVQRERDVSQREAAARRVEQRNDATARQLGELRRRLEEYGKELEEGIAALAAQQSALKEERRQAAEMHARARRMCSGPRGDMIQAISRSRWGGRSESRTHESGSSTLS